MRTSRLATAALVAAVAFALTACTGSNEPVIAPVTESVGDLQGTTVDLVVGQVLNIDTGDMPVDSYSGTVADPEVAEFVEGSDTQDAAFNPGVKALAVGGTQVVLSNSEGGIEDVTFMVNVTE